MKIKAFFLTTTLTTALTFAAQPKAMSRVETSERKIYLNGFRMPSIGLEYQRKSWSWHAGMYCTVVSQDDDGENETSWFAKAGMTWWPKPWLFVDASYLYGINLDYRNDHALMLNPGLQYAFYDVALRLGVAVLASPDHDVKINPTPGISLRFAL